MAYFRASLINIYLHTKFHSNQRHFLRTDGRTYVCMEGQTLRPASLGWLGGVDLKIVTLNNDHNKWWIFHTFLKYRMKYCKSCNSWSIENRAEGVFNNPQNFGRKSLLIVEKLHSVQWNILWTNLVHTKAIDVTITNGIEIKILVRTENHFSSPPWLSHACQKHRWRWHYVTFVRDGPWVQWSLWWLLCWTGTEGRDV